MGTENWDLVTQLADARLVVTGRNAAEQETVEVVHEALIQNWGQLRQWMENHREFRTWQERLRTALRQWEEAERDEEALLRGLPLAEAEKWQQKRLAELSRAERKYIQTSLELREREKAMRKRRQQRVTLGLTTGLIVTVTLASLTGIQWWRTEQQRQISFSRQLAAQALNQLDDKLDLSLLLSVESYRAHSTFESRNVLLTSLQYESHLVKFLRGHTVLPPVGAQAIRTRGVAFSPDGKNLAAVGWESGLVLFDVATGEKLHQLRGRVHGVTFSPDGKTLAIDYADERDSNSSITFLDVARWQELGEPLTIPSANVSSIAFSPDGKILASAHDDGTILLWNVETRQSLGNPLRIDTGYISSIAFSPNGKTLASSSSDKTIALWDVTTNQLLGKFSTSIWSTDLAFSPDGKMLASSGSNTIILWDFSPESWQNHACNIANRNLTLEEWRQYFNDEPYSKTCPNLPIHTSFTAEGIRLAKTGDVKAAVAIFRKAQKLNPEIDLNPETTTIDKEPEAVARKLSATAKVKKGERLAKEGKVQEAIALYQDAQKLNPEIDLNPETTTIDKEPEAVARKLSATAKVKKGERLAKEGNVKEAIALYQDAQKLAPDIDLNPETEAIDKDPEAVAQQLAQDAGVVGIQIAQDEEKLIIISLIQGKPAFKAGIRANGTSVRI